MEEFRFNCSRKMAERFWMVCRQAGTTPGQKLREFIDDEVGEYEKMFGPLTKSVAQEPVWPKEDR